VFLGDEGILSAGKNKHGVRVQRQHFEEKTKEKKNVLDQRKKSRRPHKKGGRLERQLIEKEAEPRTKTRPLRTSTQGMQ